MKTCGKKQNESTFTMLSQPFRDCAFKYGGVDPDNDHTQTVLKGRKVIAQCVSTANADAITKFSLQIIKKIIAHFFHQMEPVFSHNVVRMSGIHKEIELHALSDGFAQ